MVFYLGSNSFKRNDSMRKEKGKKAVDDKVGK